MKEGISLLIPRQLKDNKGTLKTTPCPKFENADKTDQFLERHSYQNLKRSR